MIVDSITSCQFRRSLVIQSQIAKELLRRFSFLTTRHVGTTSVYLHVVVEDEGAVGELF